MKIKKLREIRNLSQAEVAKGIGISQQRYSRYERGEREADYETLCRLANFFEISIDELLGRTTEPQLFDNARVERPEILELYESLTPELQEHALAYLHGLADRAAIRNVHSVNVTFEDNRRKRQ